MPVEDDIVFVECHVERLCRGLMEPGAVRWHLEAQQVRPEQPLEDVEEGAVPRVVQVPARHLDVGERRVQEEACPARVSTIRQQRRDERELVVMHPAGARRDLERRGSELAVHVVIGSPGRIGGRDRRRVVVGQVRQGRADKVQEGPEKAVRDLCVMPPPHLIFKEEAAVAKHALGR
jgi:hypothetical protein